MGTSEVSGQDYTLGPEIIGDHHYALLEHIITEHKPAGTAVEFGVGKGESTRLIAAHMPVIGFDAFCGLPEWWRPEFPQGSLAYAPPNVPGADVVIGWFDTTLPNYDFASIDIGLAHFDADLYSSTATALKFAGPQLRPGTFLVFDEMFGYDDGPGAAWRDHEYKAFTEYAQSSGITWDVIGHHNESWGIRIG